MARKEKESLQKEAENAQVTEVTDEEAAKIVAEEAAKKGDAKPAESATEEKKEGEEDKGQKPNAGNGGKTDKYTWEQSLKDVTVYITLPAGIAGKNLDVKMTNKHAKVQIKGQSEALIDKDFHKTIKMDDSMWTLESDANG